MIYNIAIVLLLFLTLGMIIHIYRYSQREMKELRNIVQGKKRTHNDVEGIEDATAVILDLLKRLEDDSLELEEFALRQKSRIQRGEKALEIVKILREGIHAYPRDVIAGKRPEGFEK